jgi:hypothetical protein
MPLLLSHRERSHPEELSFATPAFLQAIALAQKLSGPGRIKALCSVALNRKLVSSALAVKRLPVVELVMGRTETADWFGDLYPPAGRKVGGSRWAQSVLELDSDSAHYLAGNTKQPLRSNLRRARAADIVCERVNYDEFDKAAHVILDARRGGKGSHTMSRPVDHQVVAYYVAWVSDGTPCVFGSVATFGNFGLLVVLLSDPEVAEAKLARFLLHTFIVADLTSSGTSYLLVGPALGETPGNQYQVRNLRFSTVG